MKLVLPTGCKVIRHTSPNELAFDKSMLFEQRPPISSRCFKHLDALQFGRPVPNHRTQWAQHYRARLSARHRIRQTDIRFDGRVCLVIHLHMLASRRNLPAEMKGSVGRREKILKATHVPKFSTRFVAQCISLWLRHVSPHPIRHMPGCDCAVQSVIADLRQTARNRLPKGINFPPELSIHVSAACESQQHVHSRGDERVCGHTCKLAQLEWIAELLQ